jgi:hypothetical protein
MLALVPGASAHRGHHHHQALKPSTHAGGHARVFHGTFYPARDVDTYAYPGIYGHAQLVDGKKNDKLSIHIAGLQPNVAYTYSLNGSANPHPCSPTAAASPVNGFAPSYPATSNVDGVANARARSHALTTDSASTYYVIFQQGPNVLACAVLHPNKPHTAHHGLRPQGPRSQRPLKSPRHQH